jgi:hypothetical protein
MQKRHALCGAAMKVKKYEQRTDRNYLKEHTAP